MQYCTTATVQMGGRGGLGWSDGGKDGEKGRIRMYFGDGAGLIDWRGA